MDLKVLSYNSTGFDFEKASFINFLINILKIDIFILQEHMHLRQNVYKILNEFPTFESFIIPASKDNNYVCNRGRPSGGLCIFWKKSFNVNVKLIKHPHSLRVQAIQFCNNYLLINAYFPCDPQVANFDDFELLKCIEEVKWFLDSFPNYKFIFAGDLNLDLSRNTRFVNTMREFLHNYNLISVWSSFNVDFTYSNHQTTRNGNNILTTSCIDHFFVQPNILGDISEAQAIHLGDNRSNHAPIFLSVKIDSIPTVSTPENSDSNVHFPKPVWHKASDLNIHDYRSDLKCKLGNVVLSDGMLCNDPSCSDSNHYKDLDAFCNGIISSIDSAVHTNIPLSKPNASNPIKPGWSVLVKPFQDAAKFWHAIWISMGKPLNCQIYNVMKHTRNQYHYAVRRVKNNATKIEQDNMLVSFLDGKAPDLIKKLKSNRLNSKPKAPSHMDGKVGNANIADHFASKYDELYNLNESLADTNAFLNSLKFSSSDMYDVEKVTPGIVYQAINCINANKSDNVFDFKSNAFLNATDLLTNHLTLLLQAFLIHGYVPTELITCSLKPIVKDKLGDKHSSDNYRAIGISSLILKVLDWVILILFEDELKPSDLQFGFQKKNSTTMCSWVVNESINYFKNRDTPVFSCFLDLSKAFDLVTFSKLFTKLHDKISSVFIRLLAYIYVYQSCCVEWCGSKSKSFKVSNGVRQGAVISPILFSLYIDDLFSELAHSGFGCYINNVFYGILGYADDLVLLSPNRNGLQSMLNLAKSFFDKLGLKISVDHVNPKKSKTKCVSFGLKQDPLPISLDGIDLPWSDKYVHLGHVLSKDGSLKFDVDLKRRSFIGKFHEFRQELKNTHPVVFMNLILIYNSHFYGSNLWDLFAINDVYIAWNNVLRTVFDLPRCTHRYLLEPVTEFKHLFTLLTNRFIKFYQTLFSSSKNIINNLRLIQERDCRSNFGLNVRNICNRNNSTDILDCLKDSVKYYPINDSDCWRVNLLKELMSIKRNANYLEGFSADEINYLTENLACY